MSAAMFKACIFKIHREGNVFYRKVRLPVAIVVLIPVILFSVVLGGLRGIAECPELVKWLFTVDRSISIEFAEDFKVTFKAYLAIIDELT